VVDSTSPPGLGVIVVAERSLVDLLVASGAQWHVQERQPSVADMWDALSGGRLDQHSRILLFSDSTMAGTSSEQAERVQTARAVVAMSHAGARVFIAIWRPERLAELDELIGEAARTQGIAPQTLVYHPIPADRGGRALLDAMRGTLSSEVTFPDVYPPGVDAPLYREGPPPPVSADPIPADPIPADPIPAAPIPTVSIPTVSIPTVTVAPPADAMAVPTLPTLGAVTAPAASSAEYPPSASMELLNRPKPASQLTITVTSSKGGSGKSTASILLGGSIARASADAGHPLSVCLIDLDTRDGQVASLIGKFMPTALNIRVQPVWDEERIRRNLVHAEGLDIHCLLAPIRPRTADTVGPDFFRTIVRSLQRMFDVVIMDTSVQYLEPLIADVAMGEADEILFVTTLASTAVQGMARALREITAPIDESGLGVPREKIGIIVNQSVANVGMERDQVLAAGLGVPVVGVIPLATKDVLTATNLNRMHALLDHPLIGPAYNDLARACLPGREFAPWRAHDVGAAPLTTAGLTSSSMDEPDDSRRRGLFRR
jgi:cellulose biosynthesis protein BcsQ